MGEDCSIIVGKSLHTIHNTSIHVDGCCFTSKMVLVHVYSAITVAITSSTS